MVPLKLHSQSDRGSTQTLAPKLIRLNFQTLTLFEPVRDQYYNLGVSFEGAIAIRPSNPIFVPPSGQLVLMPIANRSSIVVHFSRAIQRVGALTIGTQQVKLMAFDSDHNLIARHCVGNHQYVQQHKDQTESLPHQPLELFARDIARVEFVSDSPFVLDNFFCD